MTRPLRFGVTLYPTGTASEWADAVRRAEELGYDVVTVMDHFRSGGLWAAIVAAHHAAPSLRVGTLVLNTDFWHPALLAREAITADALTGGRLELGLGAGWDLDDYRTLARARPPVGERIERLGETLEILGLAFAGERVRFHGAHFTVDATEDWPRPAQRPVPVLVGGGGRAILELAARRASIVSVSRNFQRGAAASWRPGDGDPATRRVEWIREAAGERFDELELHTSLVKVVRTRDRAGAAADVGRSYGLSAEQVLRSPHFLLGEPAEMVDDLLERRERLGISYLTLSGGDAPGGNAIESLREVIIKFRNTI
jgi:probable F420-dependent oxidoreductase